MGIPDKEAFKDPENRESIQPIWALTDDRRQAWIKWVPEAIKTFTDPSDEVKGRIQLDLKSTEDITQALGIVVGAASVAWRDDVVDGRVFDTEMALDIVTQAEHEITRRVHEMLESIVLAFELGMDADQVRAALGPQFDKPNDTMAVWLYNRFSDALAPDWGWCGSKLKANYNEPMSPNVNNPERLGHHGE